LNSRFPRHQILIKATSLGLKESSSRGIKRRRDTDSGPTTTGAETCNSNSAPPTSAPTILPATSASPAVSHTTSTPVASPIIHQQRIPSSSNTQSTTPAPPAPPTTAVNLPWPMPTVAVNTPSPVLGSSSSSGQTEPQRTSYYRNPQGEKEMFSSSSSSSPKRTGRRETEIRYMFQPNGNGSGSRLGKENGR
jgi:hypothetical protein